MGLAYLSELPEKQGKFIDQYDTFLHAMSADADELEAATCTQEKHILCFSAFIGNCTNYMKGRD